MFSNKQFYTLYFKNQTYVLKIIYIPELSFKMAKHCFVWASSEHTILILKSNWLTKKTSVVIVLLINNTVISPGVHPPNCALIQCDWPNCPGGVLPVTRPGDCCPSCPDRPTLPWKPQPVPDCSRVACTLEIRICRDGRPARVQPGECCPRCVDDKIGEDSLTKHSELILITG